MCCEHGFALSCCGLCGSSVGEITGGCGSSRGLFCSGVVGGALSFSLLCVLLDV